MFLSGLHDFDYRPRFPEDVGRFGIGIVGCGGVAQKWHLTAYRKYGLNVIGFFDVDPSVAASMRRNHPDVPPFESFQALLADPRVSVVDVATRPVGRSLLIKEALRAGKHVLTQKPAAVCLEETLDMIAEAERAGLRVAVNQNGRWAPPWRLATLLAQGGEIGVVEGVTHVYDTRLGWHLNPELHGTRHFLLYDYSMHWIDITCCWLAGRRLKSVAASEHPVLEESMQDEVRQSMSMLIECEDGANAVIRGYACAHSHRGHPFWLHGRRGTIRGSVDDRTGDWVELDKDGVQARFQLEGNWFPDGFAGTMGELLQAVDEEREPYNSLQNNLASLRVATAACLSARRDGAKVALKSIPDCQGGTR